MRRTFALVSIASVSVAIVCCEAYAPADDRPAPLEAGASDAPSAGDAESVDGGREAATSPAIGAHTPRCPRPNGPSCAPPSCERRVLYAPPSAGVEFPFDVATDSSFVYWTSLSAESAEDVPYDGRGTARIRRVARAPGSKASSIAEGQRDATAIAMAGDWLYWTAANGALWELRRVRRDCPESCVVEPIAQLGPGRFVALAEIDDETLLASRFNGTTLAIVIPKTGNVSVATAGTSADIPGLTTTSTDGFLSAVVTSEIVRVPAATRSSVPFATLPDASAGQSGLSPITTDCTTLFGWRGAQQLWKVPIEGGILSEFTTAPISLVFGLASDREFIYAAAPNLEGVVAIGIDSGIAQTIRPGNAFRIAVDEAGVYWGDHDKNAGGALWMMVK